MRTLLVVFFVVVITCGAFAQNKQVRDANERLVETWSQRGTTTDVRDRNGTLLERRTIKGNNTVEVRDANGRLLRTEKVGQ